MKPVLQLLLVMFLCTLFFSCQKEFLNPYGDTLVYDTNAQQFIDSAGITRSVERKALNNFVMQLKDSSLWTKFMAIYPMLGGTAETIKWNLVDTRDADAAFRLTLHGGPSYSSTGVLFPANSDYADTHFIDTLFRYNNNAVSYYSLTQNNVDGYDMGCIDSTAPYNELSIYHSSDASEWFGYHAWGVAPENTKGLFIFSATANDVKRYDNSIVTNAKGSAPIYGFTHQPFLLGIVSNAISGGHRECALATLGYGLSDKEVQTFYNIVQIFEAALGR
jgi:hypothetical protein